MSSDREQPTAAHVAELAARQQLTLISASDGRWKLLDARTRRVATDAADGRGLTLRRLANALTVRSALP